MNNQYRGLIYGVLSDGEVIAAFLEPLSAEDFCKSLPKTANVRIKVLDNDWQYEEGFKAGIQATKDLIAMMTFEGKLQLLTVIDDLKKTPQEPRRVETMGGMPVFVRDYIPDGCVIVVDQNKGIYMMKLGACDAQ